MKDRCVGIVLETDVGESENDEEATIPESVQVGAAFGSNKRKDVKS